MSPCVQVLELLTPQFRFHGAFHHQVQNQDVVSANYHTRFPCEYSSKITGPLRGLVCITHPRKYKKMAQVICNPSTGQSLRLPNLKTRDLLVKTFLGFDPIGKQFKLLSMTARDRENSEEPQVLTLGLRNLAWRKIECSISHLYLQIDWICVNGVIYYVAVLNGPPRGMKIVCFDVRSEKFSFINKAKDMALCSRSAIVNYKGALGALLSKGFTEVTGETKCLELWVLVDADQHEWSKHISISLPPMWNNIVAEAMLFFVGVTGTDEIVLSPRYLSEPYRFYVYYYNIESNTIRRVEIQGMDAFRHCKVHLSLNHVEDVKLLQYI
ncbi:F-box protein DOR-like isoform X2 [Raphanus sativus]|uniref:F-box protein DOR-like isoform X2 n=1 Tax=Raphanus sativus TaxID=3726 RepID=A0A6J0M9P3_RAPSA|nr:F-box protein DOR-like isoform X2 [Raphanus sativus]